MNAVAVFVVAIGLIVAAAFIGQGMRDPKPWSSRLSFVLIHVLVPAAVLRHAGRIEWSGDLLAVALLPWGLTALTLALVWLCARAFAWSRETRACALLCAPLGNTAFLGYPLIESLAGINAMPAAIVFDQIGSFALLGTYAVLVVAWYAHGEKPKPAAIAKQVLLFPPLLALIVAIALPPSPWPVAVQTLFDGLAKALMPCAAITIGLQLQWRHLNLKNQGLWPILSIKLLLLPALALAWTHGFTFSPIDTQAVVLQAGMPTMMTSAVMAARSNLNPSLAYACALFGLLLSALSLPLWAVGLGLGV